MRIASKFWLSNYLASPRSGENDLNFTSPKFKTQLEPRKKINWLFRIYIIYGIILSSYIRVIISHYKDPY